MQQAQQQVAGWLMRRLEYQSSVRMLQYAPKWRSEGITTAQLNRLKESVLSEDFSDSELESLSKFDASVLIAQHYLLKRLQEDSERQ